MHTRKKDLKKDKKDITDIKKHIISKFNEPKMTQCFLRRRYMMEMYWAVPRVGASKADLPTAADLPRDKAPNRPNP